MYTKNPSEVRPQGRRSAAALVAMSVIATGGVLLATPGVARAVAPASTVRVGQMVAGSWLDSRPYGPVMSRVKVTPRPTFAELSADHTSIRSGQSIVFSGRVTAGVSRLPLARYSLRLEQSSDTGWTALAGALANADGSVSFTVKPTASTRYRLTFVGVPSLSPSVSAEQSITVTVPPPAPTVVRRSSGSGAVSSGGVIGSNGVQASATALAFLEAARAHDGKRYVYGAAGPETFDCSGLVMYVARQFGVNLPHQANAQMAYGTPVSAANAAPGDLIFYLDGGYAYHVGIYAGGNQMFDASNSRTPIGQHTIWGSNVVFRRIL